MNAGLTAISDSTNLHQAGRNRFRDTVFLAILFSAVLNGSLLSMAHLAWLILAIFFALDLSYAVYSVFFFASFFHPSGFLKDLFFSIKHLHIAFFLLAAVQIFQNRFLPTWKKAFQSAPYFYLLFAICGIALASGIAHHESWKTFSLTANFAANLLMLTYLFGVLRQNPRLIKTSILFFLIGISIQSSIAFANLLTGKYWWNIVLIHNNHLGVLSAMSLFYGLAYGFTEKNKARLVLIWTCIAIIFMGLIFSCSRTAWLSFGAGYLFLMVSQQFYSGKARYKVPWFKFLIAGVLIWGAFQASGNLNPAVKERVEQVVGLKEANAWKYTFFIDHDNFGFLGSFRKDQVKRFLKIMKKHPFFGEGFTHEITDFHSLYLTILAGSGIAGFVIFLFFWFWVFKDFHRALTVDGQTHFLFKVSSLAAIITWFLVSGLENRLLQYPVWTDLFIAFLFIQNVPLPARDSEPAQHA